MAPLIKNGMVERGTMMIGYQPLGNRVNFIRMVATSPHLTEEDMSFVLDEVEKIGKNIIV